MSAKKTKTEDASEKTNEVKVTEKQEVEQTEVASTKKSAPLIPKAFDPRQIITVVNGFHGKLIYKSSKTTERFVWENFGDEQDMELAELKNAKGAGKAYFVNNWFMFDDPEVVEYLGMSRYYKFALNVKGFDEIFKKDAADIEGIIDNLSGGQKKSLSYRAKQLIAEGEIDSMKTISILETCLGIELIER